METEKEQKRQWPLNVVGCLLVGVTVVVLVCAYRCWVCDMSKDMDGPFVRVVVVFPS